MLEPRHVLHLIKEANAKAVIALWADARLQRSGNRWCRSPAIWHLAPQSGRSPVLTATFCRRRIFDTHIGSLTSGAGANAMFPNA